MRIYRTAMLQRMRTALVEAFPTTWRQELMRTFGPRWSELHESYLRVEASGLRETAADEFEYLGVGEFVTVAERYFRLVFPEIAAIASPRASRDARIAVLQRMKHIKDVRDAIAHRTSEDIPAADAVALMAEVRRVLRIFSLQAATDVERLIDRVMLEAVGGRSNSAVLPSGSDSPRRPAEWFWQEWEQMGEQRFLMGLYEFFSQLADNIYDASEDAHHPFDEKWGMHRAPEAIALAILDMLFGPAHARLSFRLESEEPDSSE